MLKKLMILPIAAGFLAVSASAAVTATSAADMEKLKNTDGCYQLSTINNLYGFAAIVNGNSGYTKNTSACAVVSANIKDNSSLLASNGNLSSTRNNNTWTPITNFAGSFDGGNFTISGLYVNGGEGAGLFKSVQGGAVIKNISVTDSYFRVSDYASGLVAIVDKGDGSAVTIDNCVFAGTVAGGSNNGVAENLGGLVGVVNTGAKLNLTNSHNDGRVFASTRSITGGESMKAGNNVAGLVGRVEDGASINAVNCYNNGKVDADVAKSSGLSATVNPNPNADITLIDVYTVEGVTGISGASTYDKSQEKSLSDIKTIYNNNVAAAAVNETKIADLSSTLKGVTLETVGGKLFATLNSTADELYIPEDIEVAKVVLDRKFNAGVTSTVMLPFTIEAYKLNAELLYIKSVDATGADAETETETVQAYTPYFVGEGVTSITVDGAVTLKKTTGSEEVSSDIGNWSFKARLTSKIWDAADGKSYTYSPIEVKNSEGETSVEKGAFAKIGKNVRVRPMRAYLYYNGSAATPFAAKARAGATLMNSNVIALEDLPASIPVRFIHKDIVVEKIVEPEEEEIATIEGDSEKVQAIAKPFMTPAMVKSNRWYDLKGRRMNSKPTAHGTYFNNKTPVVVK